MHHTDTLFTTDQILLPLTSSLALLSDNLHNSGREHLADVFRRYGNDLALDLDMNDLLDLLHDVLDTIRTYRPELDKACTELHLKVKHQATTIGAIFTG